MVSSSSAASRRLVIASPPVRLCIYLFVRETRWHRVVAAVADDQLAS